MTWLSQNGLHFDALWPWQLVLIPYSSSVQRMNSCRGECGQVTNVRIYVRPVECTDNNLFHICGIGGRTIAQAVSRRLPTAATRVRARVWSCGICVRQSDAGAGFLRVLGFPLPIFIPPITPQSPSSVIWSWYNRPVLAAVPSGLSLTPLRIIKK
jgi:hypothetical protein